MNKYAYLEELRKRIGRLSQYEVDNIVNDYSMTIGRMLDDYRDWDYIQAELGTPKEAAKRILNGQPMFTGNGGQRQQPVYNNNAGYNPEPVKKKNRSGFWKGYWICGIVTVPLTIALFAVIFALFASAFAMIVSGPVALIYSVIIAIMSGSAMLFFTYAAAALLVFGIGLLMLWVIKRLYAPVKLIFKGRNN